MLVIPGGLDAHSCTNCLSVALIHPPHPHYDEHSNEGYNGYNEGTDQGENDRGGTDQGGSSEYAAGKLCTDHVELRFLYLMFRLHLR